MWPFLDESTGAKIYPDRFYGFGDSGSLAGSFGGYILRIKAIKEIQKEYEDCELGTQPTDLGSYAITVLSGEEYVNRLKEIVEDEGADLSCYGKWSTAPKKLYLYDADWKGAVIILADSYDEAFQSFKYRYPKSVKMNFAKFTNHFEEIDIMKGMVVLTQGDI